jgi:alpha-glucosidase
VSPPSCIAEYEAALPERGWPNWVLGNHDRPRIASRVGAAQARLAAMLLLTLRGTPTLYYGDEIGMHDVGIPPERVQDPFERNVPGRGLGRDPQRTPMQWSAAKHAGFTAGEPWLPIAEDFTEVNVEVERDDPASMLSLYTQLITVRRGEPALEVGGFEPVEAWGGATHLCAPESRERISHRAQSRAGATGDQFFQQGLRRQDCALDLSRSVRRVRDKRSPSPLR